MKKQTGRFKLYRIFADGMVEGLGRFKTRGRARSMAQASHMVPGQVNWGVAWGYPESAIDPLFKSDGIGR